MSWTDERVETLKRMWAEGQSASQIAKELGGVTRNAVIGKVHRLGLSNRAGDGATHGEEAEAPVAAPAAAVRPEPAPRPAPEPAPRAAEPAPLGLSAEAL
ncbi:GcrA family cell cycle regulator, partial [Tabrizicola fusiformis]|uniref:GcrA family cell cycle regulator n=1 Tax=Tabrizicola sp. SY72 TaxID=2741673 RepID=UPI0024102AF0